MIDLHVHSTCSDGTSNPAELVRLALEEGLSAVALTDHDTTAGVEQFMATCKEYGLEGLPGVEISVEARPGTMHVLGYCIDCSNVALQEGLTKIRCGREVRNAEILQKLNELDITLAWEDVRGLAGEEIVGRPHFAKALVERGYVKSVRQAFDRYLARGKPAYAERFRFSPEAGIRLINGAGGVAVLAHPSTLLLGRDALEQLVGDLVPAGLGGLEAYYSEHTAKQVRAYVKLARKFRLAVTGGTDYHGDLNPGLRIGRGFGNLEVPDELLIELRSARDNARKPNASGR